MGWSRRRARALARVAGTLGLGLVAALLAAPAALYGPPARPGASGPVPAAALLVTPDAPGRCGGASVDPNLTGTLGVEGGPYPPPSVGNRTIEVAFDYLENYSSHGGAPSYQCLATNATATTDGAGAFSAVLAVPGGSGCTMSSCVYYTGPFAPVTLGVAGSAPPGYFVTASLSGTTATVDFVAALSAASLTPFGRTTVSLAAPVTLAVTGLAGNGAPSPATLSYAWTLSGSGWNPSGGSAAASYTVDSSTAGTLATVTVYVNGTFGGAAASAPAAQAFLNPVATTETGADVFPTKLDEGTPTTFTINGSGAAGYTYVARLAPGLNASAVAAPCTGSPMNGGLLALSCAATVAYAAAGVADPTAYLTNGYSASASVAYPSIAVAARLAIFASPQPALAYAGRPASLTVRVAAGTGTEPYGTACDWPGTGVLTCEAGGPNWTFTATFGRVQTYVGHVTVADAGGANVSLVTTTTVSAVPYLAAFPQTNGTVPMNRSFLLTSDYTGGALPATYWWNESLVGAPGVNTLARGTLLADGPMDLNWVPTEPRGHLIALSVVDGLGTVRTVWFNTTVIAGPMARIAATGVGSTWTVEAGHPYNVSWRAEDAFGNPTTVGLGAVTVALVPGSPGTIAWLNDSAGVPVALAAGSRFVLGVGAWTDGFLNFSIDGTHASDVEIAVTAAVPLPLGVNGTATLVVSPDFAHVRLTDPSWTAPAASYGENDTRWAIGDRFGNPIETGTVEVYTDFGGTTMNRSSSVLRGAAEVWVNFSQPYGVGGTVRVIGSWSPEALLWSATLPGPGSVTWVDLALPLGFLGLAVGSLGVAVRGRRRGAPRALVPTPALPPADEPLLRLAQGRAHVLARADPEEPRDLATLASGWTGRPPDPAELTEWVSSLVAEGTLRASVGADGTPRFVRAPPGAPPPTEAPPRIEIDAAALEAALARRPEPEPPAPDDARRTDDGSG